MSESIALIVTGAVAKGPFHAGALSVIANRQLPIGSIVGTSAGALNAVIFAAGIATGRGRLAARVSEDVWLDHASWKDIVSPSWESLRRGQLPFDGKRVRHMLAEALTRILESTEPPDRKPNDAIHLGLVATDVLGHLKSDEGPGEPAQTTYEQCFSFTGADFWDPAAQARMLDSATASANLPVLFAPWMMNDRPYADGGAVNNAPISYAIEPLGSRRVVVLSGEPAEMPVPRSLGVFAFLTHIVDILISERLFRDLRAARRTNDRLRAVERAFDDGAVPEAARAKIRQALGWIPLDIVEIRPVEPLEGSAFDGFLHRDLRQKYLEEGRRRATEVLGGSGGYA